MNLCYDDPCDIKIIMKKSSYFNLESKKKYIQLGQEYATFGKILPRYEGAELVAYPQGTIMV